MTIIEYMNDLALESTMVANEMACDAMLCDFYTANAIDEISVASESLDLTFDDEDEIGYYAEPATEAGFFKTLGNKFKEMLTSVKEWFIKIGKAIKEWIMKFVDRIKTKVSNYKEKRQAMKLAGIDADERHSANEMEKQSTEMSDKLERLRSQYRTETNASKKQQIQKEMKTLEDKLSAITGKIQDKLDSTAIQKAKIFAQSLTDGVNRAEKAFKIACQNEKTIKDIMLKIMNTKVSPNNKKSDLVGDRIWANGQVATDDTAKNALKKVKGAEAMRSDLERILDGLDRVETDVTAGVEKANEANEQLNNVCRDETTKLKVMQHIKFKLPSNELTAKASFMADECQHLADDTDRLSKAFGDAPEEGSNEKDKRPEIAKTLSAYSKVASKLVTIARSYLQIANKGELAAIAAEVA